MSRCTVCRYADEMQDADARYKGVDRTRKDKGGCTVVRGKGGGVSSGFIRLNLLVCNVIHL